MPEDRPIAITSSNQLSPDEVSRHTFATVRRGFDPAEVRTFLEEVARAITSLQEREQQLRKEVAAAEERAAHPVVDESTLTEALGQETAKVLRAAHEAAGDLLRRAEADASERIANAERRESQSREDAERASTEQAAALQEERDQAHRQAQSEADKALEDARDRVPFHGPTGAGAAHQDPDRPEQQASRAPPADRAAASRARAPVRGDTRGAGLGRRDRRRPVPRRGRCAPRRRSRRPKSRRSAGGRRRGRGTGRAPGGRNLRGGRRTRKCARPRTQPKSQRMLPLPTNWPTPAQSRRSRIYSPSSAPELGRRRPEPAEPASRPSRNPRAETSWRKR